MYSLFTREANRQQLKHGGEFTGISWSTFKANLVPS